MLHYGLLWRVPNTDYSFDKHWHYQFDPLSCPPWNIGWVGRWTSRARGQAEPRLGAAGAKVNARWGAGQG